MKKLIFILLIISMLSFGIDEPKEPVFSQVDENFSIELPKIPDPFQDIKTNTDYLIKTIIYLYPDKIIKKVIFLSNSIVRLTNFNNLSIYEIKKIEIKKWKATLVSNNLYLFLPEKYHFYLYNSKEPIEITGNIEMFNTLSTREEKFYSFFYDYWISGKNKYYRWKNSKSVVFDYNFTNPINNVVYKIEFLW